jgi:Flp pilus assembly protein TadG
MLLFTFGLVELGRYMLVRQSATHATREGARVAIRPTADQDEVIERVTQELSLFSLDSATIETEPASIDDAEPGSEVTVRVRIDVASISWVPEYFDLGATQIEAESCMRRESTE